MDKNEALQVIRSNYPTDRNQLCEALETLIPELKESEYGKPCGGIVLEDFNGGEGFYKVNLAYLNKEQVIEIEELVKKWNPELKESEEEGVIAYGESEKEYMLHKIIETACIAGQNTKQNPGWSEEDENERKRVVGLLEGWLSTFEGTCYAEDCKCGISWLNSLKQRMKGE